MNRRDFTKYTAASIAVTALPLSAVFANEPTNHRVDLSAGSIHRAFTLYGDGVHDDSTALSELMASSPNTTIWFKSNEQIATWIDNGQTLQLSGTFLIKKPIHITKAFNGKTLSGPAVLMVRPAGETFVWDTGVEFTFRKIGIAS